MYSDARQTPYKGFVGVAAEWLLGFGIKGDYGLCDADATDLFHLSGTYNLPFGRGRQFASNVGHVTNIFIGGWMVNFFYTHESGQPLTVTCPNATSADFGCVANVIPGEGPYTGGHKYLQWLNPNAFSNPPATTAIGQTNYAPLGGEVQQVRGPNFNNLDSAILKDFDITAQTRLEFRAEAFNTFNTPPFAQPGQLNFTSAGSAASQPQRTATRTSAHVRCNLRSSCFSSCRAPDAPGLPQSRLCRRPGTFPRAMFFLLMRGQNVMKVHRQVTRRWIVLTAFFCSIAGVAAAQSSPADLALSGDVTGANNQTYLEVPFTVPAHTHRISVDFEYSGKQERATLDLGIADPERFRGESGGNKSHFTISETDATPSYLPGAIPAGTWRLLIAVPNIRPQTVAHYRASIRFNTPQEDASFTSQPLATGTRWYRGDLHMHTGHSDGSCPSQSGKQVPCPVFVTVQTAASRGLDFIAITDHNADSQYDAERELQPYFDHVLLIPGREITTFHGHFNIFGVTQFVDYRIAPGGLDLNHVLQDVWSKGGIASVNHAEVPGGEACMGCRWEPGPDTDMGQFSAIEVINGGQIMFSSAKYWDQQIGDGHRLAAIGGSDSHHPTAAPGPPGSIGWPTTVVQADELSVPAILNGIRAGRTFVDLAASSDKVVDFDAESSGATAHMGGTLHTAAGAPIHVQIQTVACEGLFVHLLQDGRDTAKTLPITVKSATAETTLIAVNGRHWLRVEVRDTKGVLVLMSSPLYLNF